MLKQIYLLLIFFGLFFSSQTHLYSQHKNVDFYDPSDEVLSFFEKKAEKLIAEMTIEEKSSQMVHSSKPIERLNIDKYNWWNEALHGVARSAKATVFPQAIAMAATFDTILIRNVGNAISDEARAIYKYLSSKRNEQRIYWVNFLVTKY